MDFILNTIQFTNNNANANIDSNTNTHSHVHVYTIADAVANSIANTISNAISNAHAIDDFIFNTNANAHSNPNASFVRAPGLADMGAGGPVALWLAALLARDERLRVMQPEPLRRHCADRNRGQPLRVCSVGYRRRLPLLRAARGRHRGWMGI